MAGDRPALQWAELKVFAEEGSDLAVCVQRGEGSGRPQYSIGFGRLRDGKFLKFVRVGYKVEESGLVALDDLDIEAYIPLALRAKAFIRDEQQKREDEFQARRREQPQRDRGNNRGKKGRRDEEYGWDRE